MLLIGRQPPTDGIDPGHFLYYAALSAQRLHAACVLPFETDSVASRGAVGNLFLNFYGDAHHQLD